MPQAFRLAAGYPAKRCGQWLGSQTVHKPAARFGRKWNCASHARMRAATPFWPKPQKGAKMLFMLPPAASMNKPARNPPGATGCRLTTACCRPVHAVRKRVSGRLDAVPAANGAMCSGLAVGITPHPEPRRREIPSSSCKRGAKNRHLRFTAARRRTPRGCRRRISAGCVRTAGSPRRCGRYPAAPAPRPAAGACR